MLLVQRLLEVLLTLATSASSKPKKNNSLIGSTTGDEGTKRVNHRQAFKDLATKLKALYSYENMLFYDATLCKRVFSEETNHAIYTTLCDFLSLVDFKHVDCHRKDEDFSYLWGMAFEEASDCLLRHGKPRRGYAKNQRL